MSEPTNPLVPDVVLQGLLQLVQAHGGMGVSDDTPIARFFTLNRFVRIADGPDEVHMSQLGKAKIKEYVSMNER